MHALESTVPFAGQRDVNVAMQLATSPYEVASSNGLHALTWSQRAVAIATHGSIAPASPPPSALASLVTGASALASAGVLLGPPHAPASVARSNRGPPLLMPAEHTRCAASHARLCDHRPVRAPITMMLGLALAGCYLSHERASSDAGDAAPLMPPVTDAATIVTSDAGCALGARAVVHFEPAMWPGGFHDVTLLGAEPDAASAGVRLHLQLCGVAATCVPVDLVVSNVGDALAGVTIPAGGVNGSLGIDAEPGGAFLRVVGVSGRFDGALNVYGGTYRGLDGRLVIASDHVQCTTDCGDSSAIRITGGGGSLVVGAGESIDGPAGSPRIRLVTGADDPCARCNCGIQAWPATGILLYDDHFATGH
jgi:hypothetical protein